MSRFPLLLSSAALLAFAGNVSAQTQPAPFKSGIPSAGKAIVERDCVSCHAAKFPKDPNEIYRRPDHKIKTPSQLLSQVQACNMNLGKQYFPEDEENIAAYLNSEFYHFKP
jgi:mono/diheme cytochrome c family protein